MSGFVLIDKVSHQRYSASNLSHTMGNGPEVPSTNPQGKDPPPHNIVQLGEEVIGFHILNSPNPNPNLIAVSIFTRGVAQGEPSPDGEKDLTKRRLAQTVSITKLYRHSRVDSALEIGKFEPQYLMTTEKLLTTFDEMFQEPVEDPMISLTKSYLQRTKKGAISDEEFETNRTTVENSVRRAQELWKKLFDYKVKQYASEDDPRRRAWGEIVNAVGSVTGAMITRASEVGIKFYQSLLDEPKEVVKELDNYMKEDPSEDVLAIVHALREDALRFAEEGKPDKEE